MKYTVIFSVFPWLFYKIFSLVSYLSMNFWWSLGTCSFPLSYKFMNLTFCIDKRYRACGLSVVIGNWRSFIYALCRLGFSSQKSRSQWINGMNSDGLCSHNVIFLGFQLSNTWEAISCFWGNGRYFGPYWYFYSCWSCNRFCDFLMCLVC